MRQELNKKHSNELQHNDTIAHRAQFYIQQATSDNTRKAYQQDIRHFEQWGGLLPANSQCIIRYLLDHAQHFSTRTLQRRLVALKQFHVYQGFLDPTAHPSVQKTMIGIQKTHGKPKAKAPALRLEQLEQCIKSWPATQSANDLRNQAMMCVGFSAPFAVENCSTFMLSTSAGMRKALRFYCQNPRPIKPAKGSLRHCPF